MARDLHDETRIVSCPTVREEDGLALSSRNAYLAPEERRAAPVLYRALRSAAASARAGETDSELLVSRSRAMIAREPLARLEYFEAVDGETLEPVATAGTGTLLAVAAWFGRARLIDNIDLKQS
jgi:pantoate--beta-alanine ligase